MKEKILDIKLPQQKESLIFNEKEKGSKKFPNFPKFFLKKLLIFGAGILIFFIVVLVFTYFFGVFRIHVYLQTQQKLSEVEVELNVEQETLDLENKIIPAKFFETKQTASLFFTPTGKQIKESRAQGIIKIYNAYRPPRSFVFRAETRFLSAEGEKIFRAPEKIYIPPAKIEKGKLVPGEVEVKVIAQAPGEDYNIGPSKFSVPGLVGTPYYFSIWAESQQPMTGGRREEVTVVSEDDLDSAREKLKKNLLEKARKDILKNLPPSFEIANDAYMIKDFQFNASKKEGEQAKNFSAVAEMEVAMLAFKKDDLKEIILTQLKKEIPPEKEVDLARLSFELFPQNLLSETGKLIVLVKGRVPIYDKVSKKNIYSLIKGKKKSSIKEILLKEYPQIEKIEFEFSPFWLRFLSKPPLNIEVEISPGKF